MPNHVSNDVNIFFNNKEEAQAFVGKYFTNSDDETKTVTLDDVENTDIGIDFNKFVPMPVSIETAVSGSAEYQGKILFASENKDNLISTLTPYQQDKVKELYGLEPTQTLGDLVSAIEKSLRKFNEDIDDFINKTIDDYLSYRHPGFGVEYVPVYDEFQELFLEHHKQMHNLKKFGHKTWYDWSIDNWGTKWNAYDHTGFVYDYYPEGKEWQHSIGFGFNTAWGTPEPIYELLADVVPYFEAVCIDEFGNFAVNYKGLDGNLDVHMWNDQEITDYLKWDSEDIIDEALTSSIQNEAVKETINEN